MFLRTLVGFFERIPFFTASAAFFALLAALPEGLALVAVLAAVAAFAASGAGAGVFLDGMAAHELLSLVFCLPALITCHGQPEPKAPGPAPGAGAQTRILVISFQSFSASNCPLTCKSVNVSDALKHP